MSENPIPLQEEPDRLFNALLQRASTYFLTRDRLSETDFDTINTALEHIDPGKLPNERAIRDYDTLRGLVDWRLYHHDLPGRSFDEVTERFSAAFPDLPNSLELQRGEQVRYSEPDKRGLASYVRLSPNEQGFFLRQGRAPVDTESRIDLSGRKVGEVFVAPLFRSRNPNINRPWDLWEAREAAEVVRLKQKRIVVDEKMLALPASWNISTNQSHTMQELVGFLVKNRFIPDARLAGLANDEHGKIRRPFDLSYDELARMAQARITAKGVPLRISDFGQIAVDDAVLEIVARSQIGNRIMRRQVVEIETALSQMMMGDMSVSFT